VIITRDNLHLSEPILGAEAAGQGAFRSEFKIACLDPAICELVEAATPPNTRRAYRSDIDHFLAWGGSIPATPELVAGYLADHAKTLATATLARHLVSIRRAHALEGPPHRPLRTWSDRPSAASGGSTAGRSGVWRPLRPSTWRPSSRRSVHPSRMCVTALCCWSASRGRFEGVS
jgi:hypothetical protein